MSYPSFPSIQAPSYDPGNKDDWPEWEDAVIESKAAGYVISRAANTRLAMGHIYVWPSMPDSDYASLKSFINGTIRYAGAFVWTYPGTSTTVNMKLTAKPDSYQDKYGSWHVVLAMREV